MKYMGSKRWMLGNGLGHLLDELAPHCGRFVDLFSGSAVVAAFVATRHEVPVLSADLQAYGKVLAGSIIERTQAVAFEPAWSDWHQEATRLYRSVRGIPDCEKLTHAEVSQARRWCAARRKWFITRAYGGHYYSPSQSIWLDAFRGALPKAEPYRTVALAALIDTAANCAAAPGHTAQPFQPTRTAKSSLKDYWVRDVETRVRERFKSICGMHAKKLGMAQVGDALNTAADLKEGDLVFLDPPYSAVHYSRFYHVLETVATGYKDGVTGIGRYPANAVRPKSDFSILTKSKSALDALLRKIASQKADAIVTFPSHKCSNGLSGRSVTRIASKYFDVERRVVTSRFSSLGGRSGKSQGVSERAARRSTKELILHLRQRL